MTAHFILILSYVIGGMPAGQNSELFHFQIDQVSLEACEQSKAKIQADFGGMTGGCHMKIPELLDPASPPPCRYPLYGDGGYTITGQPCPRYWPRPAAVHAP